MWWVVLYYALLASGIALAVHLIRRRIREKEGETFEQRDY